jgi:hypothetical protein
LYLPKYSSCWHVYRLPSPTAPGQHIHTRCTCCSKGIEPRHKWHLPSGCDTPI